MKDDLLSLYIKYSVGTECPTFFHRWSIITCLGAYIGRNIYFRQGHFKIHANLYTMLVGDAGTKKSTAIKMAARLMKLAGYNKFAAKKTRQEKFLLDMSEMSLEGAMISGDTILEQNLFGVSASDMPAAEILIAADEFNNFIGIGNIEFMSILGELWDWGEEVYDYKLKNSKSVYINNPTVSILGGNTATGMNACFPADLIGQGFFSRLILINADPIGEKHTWMPLPDPKLETEIITLLHHTKNTMLGEITLTPIADKLLDKIYKSWKPLEDVRFASYSNRRFPTLLKLILIICANNLTMKITEKEVIYANTLLTAAEKSMPNALGEYGKGRNSDITHKVLKLIESVSLPIAVKDIWKHVYADLEKREQLFEILGNLTLADKIQVDQGDYLPKRLVEVKDDSSLVDWSIFDQNEISY